MDRRKNQPINNKKKLANEVELHIFKRYFEKYLEYASILFLVLDKEGRVNLINKKGVELLGYPKEEIIGKNWFMNFLPEEIRSETKKYFKKILRGESSIDDYYENPVITKYGVKILWWQNTLLNNSKEEIFCVLLSAEDITERKKTDIETQSEMTYLSHLVEIAPVGIVVTDNFGKVLRVNSEFVHMFGYEAERGRWTKYRHPGGPPRCPEGSQSYHRVCPSGREGFFGNGTAQEGRHSH